MTDNLISLCLAWIFIGSTVWALSDPAQASDHALRAFVRRHGRLPGRGRLALMTLALIVVWPKLAAALWRRV